MFNKKWRALYALLIGIIFACANLFDKIWYYILWLWKRHDTLQSAQLPLNKKGNTLTNQGKTFDWRMRDTIFALKIQAFGLKIRLSDIDKLSVSTNLQRGECLLGNLWVKLTRRNCWASEVLQQEGSLSRNRQDNQDHLSCEAGLWIIFIIRSYWLEEYVNREIYCDKVWYQILWLWKWHRMWKWIFWSSSKQYMDILYIVIFPICVYSFEYIIAECVK